MRRGIVCLGLDKISAFSSLLEHDCAAQNYTCLSSFSVCYTCSVLILSRFTYIETFAFQGNILKFPPSIFFSLFLSVIDIPDCR